MGSYWSAPASPPVDDSLAETAAESEAVESGGDTESYSETELDDFYTRRKVERAAEMEAFRRELARKRAAREEAVAAVRREMRELREERDRRREREEGDRSREREDEEELRQRAAKVEELEKQVRALKDVASIGKQILAIRERQVAELSEKLRVLEETGSEYEAEVRKVKRLRELYEERERAREAEARVELERERARTAVAETRLSLANQDLRAAQGKAAEDAERGLELAQKVESLSQSLEEAREEISRLRLELATRGEEVHDAKSQLSVVNGLFSGLLTGEGGGRVDRLARLLEENRPLLTDLTAKGRMDEVASVLMEVASPPPDLAPHPEDQQQDISHDLTKVLRVLVELLGLHHKHSGADGVPESCYKSVETPKGTRMVISPSQTFIRLKDLILEKNSLVKEVGRLKVLNGHLESRLEEQEKRLSLVTTELRKTWGVVNKMRSQHKQLHTQKKILRYELQHKRHLLTELKKELETCRQLWERVRAKNSQTEEDWRILREEFAMRKKTGGGGESTESGFEDEAEDSLGSEEAEEEEPEAPPATALAVKDDRVEETRPDAGEVSGSTAYTMTVTYTPPEEPPDSQHPLLTAPLEFQDEAAAADPTLAEPTVSSERPRERTTEEILEARDARLKRLEDQCRSLFARMSSTSVRSDAISNKLQELHQQYGDQPTQQLPLRGQTIVEAEEPVEAATPQGDLQTSEASPQNTRAELATASITFTERELAETSAAERTTDSEVTPEPKERQEPTPQLPTELSPELSAVPNPEEAPALSQSPLASKRLEPDERSSSEREPEPETPDQRFEPSRCSSTERVDLERIQEREPEPALTYLPEQGPEPAEESAPEQGTPVLPKG